MTDRPILFSGPMVRAILDGTKSQTRRVLNPQPYDFRHPTRGHRCWNVSGFPGGRVAICDRDLLDLHHKPASGDRLWVRESWRVSPDAAEGWHPEINRGLIDYQAGGSCELVAPSFDAVESAAFTKGDDRDWDFMPSRYRPSIHMPRWASRITLTVTDVRVERLQDISCADALAEGVPRSANSQTIDCDTPDPRENFHALWNHINGPEAWDANPWVCAVSFSAEQRNIDQ